MKMEEGLLRCDWMDTGAWCFDLTALEDAGNDLPF